jgi:uncharacterized membrane protein
MHSREIAPGIQRGCMHWRVQAPPRATFRSQAGGICDKLCPVAINREIEDVARDLIRHQHDHPPVRDLNRDTDRKQTLADRIGSDFARLIGSWVFVLAQVGLMIVWVILNAVASLAHWDAYPYQLLNLVLSLEAALWASLVLMALNRMYDRDRLRAQHDYELDVKTEEETKALMNHLMHQDEILLQVLNRLDRGDREMKRLVRRLEGNQSIEPVRPGGG